MLQNPTQITRKLGSLSQTALVTGLRKSPWVSFLCFCTKEAVSSPEILTEGPVPLTPQWSSVKFRPDSTVWGACPQWQVLAVTWWLVLALYCGGMLAFPTLLSARETERLGWIENHAQYICVFFLFFSILYLGPHHRYSMFTYGFEPRDHSW